MGNFKEKSAGATARRDFTLKNLQSWARESGPATGFPALDRALGGGLAPGLIVLGASPGLGKSTFALQVAAHVAEGGAPVLYFSQEMPRERMIAKVITGRLFASAPRPKDRTEALKTFFTAADLFNGASLRALEADPQKRADYEKALESMDRNGDLIIEDDPMSAEDIAGKVRELKEKEGRAPLVIVDYLQILPRPAGRALSERQIVDDNLKVMRELARGDRVPVLLISSLNRSGYNDPIQMEAFKETGGIEFSADVLLGLQFRGTGSEDKKQLDLIARKQDFPRSMELVILKQRYGSAGESIRLDYYAEFDTFVPCDSRQTPGGTETAGTFPAAGGEGETTGGAAASPGGRPKRGPATYINNTLIANELRQGRRGERVTRTVERNRKTERQEFLRFDPEVWMKCHALGHQKDAPVTRFRLSGELSRYDLYVADAVFSLWQARKRSFSLGQALKALSGDGRQTVTAQKMREIRESLERLMAATIEIDCAQEMAQRQKKQPGLKWSEERVLRGQFLTLERTALEGEGGDAALRYQFPPDSRHGAMPLYEYASLSGQIISFPRNLLAVEGPEGRKLSDTQENIMLKRYLVARLEAYSNPKGQSRDSLNKLRYVSTGHGRGDTGLLAALGVDPKEERAKAKRLHEALIATLDYYKRVGYIKDYKEQRDERGNKNGFDVEEGMAAPKDLFE